MKIERLNAALKEMQEIAEELQSEVEEFNAKKSDWYDRNLMLNYSGLMDDKEFQENVWNVMHKQLSNDFDSTIHTLQWAMEKFSERFEEFEKVSSTFDAIRSKEKDRVPEGWKSYKVKYNEKGCAVEQEFFCYAPSVEKAFEFCKNVNGSDVLSINGAEEDIL